MTSNLCLTCPHEGTKCSKFEGFSAPGVSNIPGCFSFRQGRWEQGLSDGLWPLSLDTVLAGLGGQR